jgi:hypothetical protein
MLAGKKISSLQDAFALLNCHRLPARLNTSEVAVLLGFQEHDVAPLVAAKLLTPLASPLRMLRNTLRPLRYWLALKIVIGCLMPRGRLRSIGRLKTGPGRRTANKCATKAPLNSPKARIEPPKLKDTQ